MASLQSSQQHILVCWRPNSRSHALFSRKTRVVICTVLALAAIREGVPRYVRAPLHRLPLEIVYYALEFVADRPVRDYSISVPCRMLLFPELHCPRNVQEARDGTMFVTDAQGVHSLSPEGTIRHCSGDFWGLAVLPDGGIACTSCTAYGQMGFLTAFDALLSHPRLVLAELTDPDSVAVDGVGNFLVSDATKSEVRVFSRDGELVRKIGEDAQLNRPHSIAVTSTGTVLVCDWGNSRVVECRADGPLLRELPLACASIDPEGIALDAADNLVIADSEQCCVTVYAEDGRVLWRTGSRGQGDGELWFPIGVAVSASGAILVADANNNRVLSM